ncbi:uncharacterized protein ACIB01_019298 [Guaruba guarouba]
MSQNRQWPTAPPSGLADPAGAGACAPEPGCGREGVNRGRGLMRWGRVLRGIRSQRAAPEVTRAAMPLAARLGRSLLRSMARPGPAPRGLISGPPQEPLGTGETVVGFTAIFMSLLAPAAWILGHLEDYKKRE